MGTVKYFSDLHKSLLNNPVARQQALLAGENALSYFHTYKITSDADIYTTRIQDMLIQHIFGKEAEKITALPKEKQPTFCWIDVATFTVSVPSYNEIGHSYYEFGGKSYKGLYKGYGPFIRINDSHVYIFGFIASGYFFPFGVIQDPVKSLRADFRHNKWFSVQDSFYYEFPTTSSCVVDISGFLRNAGFIDYFYSIVDYWGQQGDESGFYSYYTVDFIFDENNPYKGRLFVKTYIECTVFITHSYGSDIIRNVYTKDYIFDIDIASFNSVKPFHVTLGPLQYEEYCEDVFMYKKHMHSFTSKLDEVIDEAFPFGEWVVFQFPVVPYSYIRANHLDMFRTREFRSNEYIYPPDCIFFFPVSANNYPYKVSGYNFAPVAPAAPRRTIFIKPASIPHNISGDVDINYEFDSYSVLSTIYLQHCEQMVIVHWTSPHKKCICYSSYGGGCFNCYCEDENYSMTCNCQWIDIPSLYCPYPKRFSYSCNVYFQGNLILSDIKPDKYCMYYGCSSLTCCSGNVYYYYLSRFEHTNEFKGVPIRFYFTYDYEDCHSFTDVDCTNDHDYDDYTGCSITRTFGIKVDNSVFDFSSSSLPAGFFYDTFYISDWDIYSVISTYPALWVNHYSFYRHYIAPSFQHVAVSFYPIINLYTYYPGYNDIYWWDGVWDSAKERGLSFVGSPKCKVENEFYYEED